MVLYFYYFVVIRVRISYIIFNLARIRSHFSFLNFFPSFLRMFKNTQKKTIEHQQQNQKRKWLLFFTVLETNTLWPETKLEVAPPVDTPHNFHIGHQFTKRNEKNIVLRYTVAPITIPNFADHFYEEVIWILSSFCSFRNKRTRKFILFKKKKNFVKVLKNFSLIWVVQSRFKCFFFLKRIKNYGLVKPYYTSWALQHTVIRNRK